MPRHPLFVAAFALSLAIFAAPAAADDWNDCNQGADPDLSIKGCSAILERGRETEVDRAIAYHNRRGAYYGKNDYDRAIADYNRAIAVAIGPSGAEREANSLILLIQLAFMTHTGLREKWVGECVSPMLCARCRP